MDKKILIAYYSLQGNTRKTAKALQNIIGGDIFEIELEKPYSMVSAFTLGIIHSARGNGPSLKRRVENLDDYDTVLVGGPVWAYTLTFPVMSFLKTHDLSNKAVIPFCTHDGAAGKYFEKFVQNCPNADLSKSKEFLKVKSKNDDELTHEVSDWIGDNGFKKITI